MKRYLKKFRIFTTFFSLFVCVLGVSLVHGAEYGGDPSYTSVLHPPVIAIHRGIKIAVLFFKSELRGEIESSHIGCGEIYYMQIHPLRSELHRVSAIECDEIASVFFYEWRDSSGEQHKSLYTLVKTKSLAENFKGFYYSTLEYPLISYKGELSLNFSHDEPQWDALAGCMDGVDLKKNKKLTCQYKDAASIKKYLASQHGKRNLFPK